MRNKIVEIIVREFQGAMDISVAKILANQVADAILALEVKGKYTYSPACCESKGDVDACFQHREPSDKCKGCFYYLVNRRPATIADLVGGE